MVAAMADSRGAVWDRPFSTGGRGSDPYPEGHSHASFVCQHRSFTGFGKSWIDPGSVVRGPSNAAWIVSRWVQLSQWLDGVPEQLENKEPLPEVLTMTTRYFSKAQ